MISHKFLFPPQKVQETTKCENCHQKQEMCQVLVICLHRAKPNTPVTLAFPEENITIFAQRQDH